MAVRRSSVRMLATSKTLSSARHRSARTSMINRWRRAIRPASRLAFTTTRQSQASTSPLLGSNVLSPLRARSRASCARSSALDESADTSCANLKTRLAYDSHRASAVNGRSAADPGRLLGRKATTSSTPDLRSGRPKPNGRLNGRATAAKSSSEIPAEAHAGAEAQRTAGQADVPVALPLMPLRTPGASPGHSRATR